jgi:uncharacterized protein
MNDNALHSKDVFIIPVRERFLVWSPLRRLAVFLNRKGADLLYDALHSGTIKAADRYSMRQIIRQFREPAPANPLPQSGHAKPPFLGIIPTRSCNLSCAYCDFGAASAHDGQMEFLMAVNAVDWMAETVRVNGDNTLEIHFFGGEPFTAGDVVDVTVHRARLAAAELGLTPRFEAATNGVFDENRMRFVGDYFDAIVLSFDGKEDIHNLHRPMNKNKGSFTEVARTADHLSHADTELCFRACVTHRSVNRLAETAQWFSESFSPSIVVFETIQPTGESAAAGILPPDPYIFASEYMRASTVLNRFGIKAVYSSADTSMVRHSFCPLGKDTVIISPDGRASSCYLPREQWIKRGLDMDIGRLGTDGVMLLQQVDIERLRTLTLKKPLCERCFCKWTCAGGCHVNQSWPGCAVTYNDFCIQTRILTACSLLNELGMQDIMHEFLADRVSMEALALRLTDRMEEWDGK